MVTKLHDIITYVNNVHILPAHIMLYIHPLGQEKLSSIQRWPDYTVQFQQNIPLWVFFLNLDKGGRWGGGGGGGGWGAAT